MMGITYRPYRTVVVLLAQDYVVDKWYDIDAAFEDNIFFLVSSVYVKNNRVKKISFFFRFIGGIYGILKTNAIFVNTNIRSTNVYFA